MGTFDQSWYYSTFGKRFSSGQIYVLARIQPCSITTCEHVLWCGLLIGLRGWWSDSTSQELRIPTTLASSHPKLVTFLVLVIQTLLNLLLQNSICLHRSPPVCELSCDPTLSPIVDVQILQLIRGLFHNHDAAKITVKLPTQPIAGAVVIL